MYLLLYICYNDKTVTLFSNSFWNLFNWFSWQILSRPLKVDSQHCWTTCSAMMLKTGLSLNDISVLLVLAFFVIIPINYSHHVDLSDLVHRCSITQLQVQHTDMSRGGSTLSRRTHAVLSGPVWTDTNVDGSTLPGPFSRIRRLWRTHAVCWGTAGRCSSDLLSLALWCHFLPDRPREKTPDIINLWY